MSDEKKYYYIRLKDSFFESEEILIIENLPDGFLFTNILLKLYLRSLKNEGKLMFKNTIPYNSQLIASMTRQPVSVVEKAINIFEKLNLIEILESGAIFMTNIQEYIGKTTTEADRKRAYRNRIENEKNLLNIGQMSDKILPESRDKRIDNKEQRIEEDIVLEEKSKNFINNKYFSVLQVIADAYNEKFIYPNGYTLNQGQKLLIGKHLEEGEITSQEILNIIDRMPEKAKSPLAYLLKSIEQLEEERRIERKIIAHNKATQYYSTNEKGGIEDK